MNLLLFPNNLYEVRYFPKNELKKVYLLEDPVFFGHRDIKMKFNKLKLVLHRGSMKYYEDYLKEKKIKVDYINLDELDNLKYKFLKGLDNIGHFELNDHLLESRLKKYMKGKKVTVFSNPNFLVSLDQLEKYHNKKTKNNKYFHKNFYDFMKGELKLLEKTKSYDEENRNKLPSGIKIPNLPKKKVDKYEKEAIKYIDKLFPKNYGSSDNLLFPLNHIESKKWVKYFIKEKLDKYGTYQDAIVDNEGFMFHANISPMMNIGLINPDYVVDEITEYYNKNKKKVGINNYEGFIRQIIGWREYQRYCYLYAYKDLTKPNYFGHKNKLNKKWYDGTTGIRPIDDSIKFAFKTGYLHHIIRLMVVSNFMNLCRIKPDDCYKWFMEFAVDSYDWVMIQNVYSMGQWADGGLTMRKPYISSDNYIVNMSNYKREDWGDKWNDLYYYFISDHEDKLKKTPYIRNLVHWKKKSKKEKDEIIKSSKKLIKNLT
jgi:deoxyribodipyrimidine photolyase-related protein